MKIPSVQGRFEALSIDKESDSMFSDDVAGVIDQDAKTVVFSLPQGTDKSSLILKYTIEGNSVRLGGQDFASGDSADFSGGSLSLEVVGADGSTVSYSVSVNIVSLGRFLTVSIDAQSDAALTGDVAGVIDESAKTVTFVVPGSVDKTALILRYTIEGSSVRLGSQDFASGDSADFSGGSLSLEVVGADGSTVSYSVSVNIVSLGRFLTVSIDAQSDAALTGDVAGVIDESAKTVTFVVPGSVDKTALILRYTIEGSSVRLGSQDFASGDSADFSGGSLSLEVVGADGSTVSYSVSVNIVSLGRFLTVSIDAQSDAALTGDVAGVIDESAKTVTFVVPGSVDKTALILRYTIEGNSVRLGGQDFASGDSADFSDGDQTFEVVGADGSTVSYSVSVNIVSLGRFLTVSIDAQSDAALTGDVAGVIDESAKTVTFVVPGSVDKTALILKYTIEGNSARLGGQDFASGDSADFSDGDQTFEVVGADGGVASYRFVMSPPGRFLTFDIDAGSNSLLTDDLSGMINENRKSITLVIPKGMDTSSLKIKFTIEGDSVEFGGQDFPDGSTVDFSGDSQTFEVFSAGMAVSYSVEVKEASPKVNVSGNNLPAQAKYRFMIVQEGKESKPENILAISGPGLSSADASGQFSLNALSTGSVGGEAVFDGGYYQVAVWVDADGAGVPDTDDKVMVKTFQVLVDEVNVEFDYTTQAADFDPALYGGNVSSNLEDALPENGRDYGAVVRESGEASFTGADVVPPVMSEIIDGKAEINLTAVPAGKYDVYYFIDQNGDGKFSAIDTYIKVEILVLAGSSSSTYSPADLSLKPSLSLKAKSVGLPSSNLKHLFVVHDKGTAVDDSDPLNGAIGFFRTKKGTLNTGVYDYEGTFSNTGSETDLFYDGQELTVRFYADTNYSSNNPNRYLPDMGDSRGQADITISPQNTEVEIQYTPPPSSP